MSDHYGWNVAEALRRAKRAEIEDAFREGRVSTEPSLANPVDNSDESE